MERIDKVLAHPIFKEYMAKIKKEEESRLYCLHDFEHSLDVARIGYIINMEKQLGLPKDIIYAAGLLHDIGRPDEYELGLSHHERSAKLAEIILMDCDYKKEEIEAISKAIAAHKHKGKTEEYSLRELLFEADKLSRKCFDCAMYDSCYWPEEQKNKTIIL